MLGMTKHTWLADSGASSHYVNNDDGMFDVKIQDSSIMIGNSKQMRSIKTGSIKMTGKDSSTFYWTRLYLCHEECPLCT